MVAENDRGNRFAAAFFAFVQTAVVFSRGLYTIFTRITQFTLIVAPMGDGSQMWDKFAAMPRLRDTTHAQCMVANALSMVLYGRCHSL